MKDKKINERGAIGVIPILMITVAAIGSFVTVVTPGTLNDADIFKATTKIQRAVLSIYADPDALDGKKEYRNESWLTADEFMEMQKIISQLEQENLEDSVPCYKPEELKNSEFLNSYLWPWFEDKNPEKDDNFRAALQQFLR